MSVKNWLTRLSAATLALVLGAGAVVADDGLSGLVNRLDAAASGSSRPAASAPRRPAFSPSTLSGNAEARRSPTNAQEVFRLLNGEEQSSYTPATESAAKRRYFVCFLQTQRFAYFDVYRDPENEEGLIARAGETYDEPLRMAIEASYCLAGITLRSLGNFDDMVTIAGPHFNKAQVEATFDALAAQTNPGDEIVLYWSGHGMKLLTDDDGDERDISDSEGQSADVDEALVLFESCLVATSEPNVLPDQPARDTTVVDDDLSGYFEKLKGRSVVALFEVCHAGGLAVRSEITTRAGSRALSSFSLPKPKLPPVVNTWDGLKTKVDSTGELLKVAGYQFAIRAKAVAQRRGAGGTIEPSSDGPSLDGLIRRVAARKAGSGTNANARRAGSSNETLKTLIEAGDSKGLLDAGANWLEGASKDLTRQTLEKIAVAMTCLTDESSYCGLWFYDKDDGTYYRAPTDPGAAAISFGVQSSASSQERLTFGDFKGWLDTVVTMSNEAMRGAMPTAGIEVQTPCYVSNWDDAVLYDPSWEFIGTSNGSKAEKNGRTRNENEFDENVCRACVGRLRRRFCARRSGSDRGKRKYCGDEVERIDDGNDRVVEKKRRRAGGRLDFRPFRRTRSQRKFAGENADFFETRRRERRSAFGEEKRARRAQRRDDDFERKGVLSQTEAGKRPCDVASSRRRGAGSGFDLGRF